MNVNVSVVGCVFVYVYLCVPVLSLSITTNTHNPIPSHICLMTHHTHTGMSYQPPSSITSSLTTCVMGISLGFLHWVYTGSAWSLLLSSMCVGACTCVLGFYLYLCGRRGWGLCWVGGSMYEGWYVDVLLCADLCMCTIHHHHHPPHHHHPLPTPTGLPITWDLNKRGSSSARWPPSPMPPPSCDLVTSSCPLMTCK